MNRYLLFCIKCNKETTWTKQEDSWFSYCDICGNGNKNQNKEIELHTCPCHKDTPIKF